MRPIVLDPVMVEDIKLNSIPLVNRIIQIDIDVVLLIVNQILPSDRTHCVYELVRSLYGVRFSSEIPFTITGLKE